MRGGGQPITVRNAIYNIQRKLKFSNKQELVFWAVQNGLVGAGSEAS